MNGRVKRSQEEFDSPGVRIAEKDSWPTQWRNR